MQRLVVLLMAVFSIFLQAMPFVALAQDQPFMGCSEITTGEVQSLTSVFVVRSAESPCTWRWNGAMQEFEVPENFVVVNMTDGEVTQSGQQVSLEAFAIVYQPHFESEDELAVVVQSESLTAAQPQAFTQMQAQTLTASGNAMECPSEEDVEKQFTVDQANPVKFQRIPPELNDQGEIVGEDCAFFVRGIDASTTMPTGWTIEYQTTNNSTLSPVRVTETDGSQVEHLWGATIRQTAQYEKEISGLPMQFQDMTFSCMLFNKSFFFGYTESPQFTVENNVRGCEYSPELFQYFADEYGRDVTAPETLDGVFEAQADTCTIANSGTLNVNIRARTTTESDSVALLAPNETIVATGQARGADDQMVWYRVENGWVRSDVVIAEEACSALPPMQ